MEKHYFESLDSTNATCKRWVREKEHPQMMISAKSQTAGYGTRGRLWQSLSGGLYLSWYLGEATLTSHPQITVASALGVVDYFLAYQVDLKIEWPNDLWLGGKKVGGILAERFVARGQHHLVLGLGLNLLQDENSFADCPFLATSIKAVTHIHFEPMEVLDNLFECVKKRVEQALCDPEALRYDFCQMMAIGKEEAIVRWRI